MIVQESPDRARRSPSADDSGTAGMLKRIAPWEAIRSVAPSPFRSDVFSEMSVWR